MGPLFIEHFYKDIERGMSFTEFSQRIEILEHYISRFDTSDLKTKSEALLMEIVKGGRDSKLEDTNRNHLIFPHVQALIDLLKDPSYKRISPRNRKPTPEE